MHVISIKTVPAICFLLLFSGISFAETAIIVSEASIYQRPTSLSTVVTQLTAGTKVEELSRLGGWKQVSAKNNVNGWVRSYQVRTSTITVTEKEHSDGGFFSSLASLSRKASGLFSSKDKGYSFQRTATIGVRGLSEEDIKNAKPDLKQLKKLESFRSNRKSAKSFAKQGKVVAIKLKHMPKSGVEK